MIFNLASSQGWTVLQQQKSWRRESPLIWNLFITGGRTDRILFIFDPDPRTGKEDKTLITGGIVENRNNLRT